RVRLRYELALQHAELVGIDLAVVVQITEERPGLDAASLDRVRVDAGVLGRVHRLEVAAVARLRDVLAVLRDLVDYTGPRFRRVPAVARVDRRVVGPREPLATAAGLLGDRAVVVRPTQAEVQRDARIAGAILYERREVPHLRFLRQRRVVKEHFRRRR